MTTLSKTTQKIEGILYIGQCYVRVPADITPLNIGRIILKRAMREEGLKFNSKGRTEWLNGWADFLNENEGEGHTVNGVIDYAIDSLLWSNAPHIIGINREQVPNEYVNQVAKELINLLETENK